GAAGHAESLREAARYPRRRAGRARLHGARHAHSSGYAIARARACVPALCRGGTEILMLVDSHCHLDFPDFAAELDAVVARARAAGIGRMVTISTRVKRHAQVLAVAERFADVLCSVGTHPHHADEELDIDAAALMAIARHPKVVAIGE